MVLNLPDPIPVTEGELRAIEILLGNSLKELLADTSKSVPETSIGSLTG